MSVPRNFKNSSFCYLVVVLPHKHRNQGRTAGGAMGAVAPPALEKVRSFGQKSVFWASISYIYCQKCGKHFCVSGATTLNIKFISGKGPREKPAM